MVAVDAPTISAIDHAGVAPRGCWRPGPPEPSLVPLHGTRDFPTAALGATVRPVGVHIVWFDDYEDAHGPVVGGKCASLGAMTAGGLARAARLRRHHRRLRRVDRPSRRRAGAVLAAIGSIDVRDLEALAAAAAAARRPCSTPGPAHAVERSVRAAYAAADRAHRAAEDAAVAVRSSATAEDQPDASLRRPAGHVPVGARRGRRGQPRRALLGVALHRPGHRLPRRAAATRTTRWP